MTDADIKSQMAGDIGELRVTASEYPPGSVERLAFIGFATTLAERYALTDEDKLEIVLQMLAAVQPCTKSDLVERLDFSRDECRRLIESAISGGMIESFNEMTAGRPRILLRIP
jgi:predicted transcriptional regulator